MPWWLGATVTAIGIIGAYMAWRLYRLNLAMRETQDEMEAIEALRDPYDDGWSADDDQWWPTDNPDAAQWMPPPPDVPRHGGADLAKRPDREAVYFPRERKRSSY